MFSSTSIQKIEIFNQSSTYKLKKVLKQAGVEYDILRDGWHCIFEEQYAIKKNTSVSL